MLALYLTARSEHFRQINQTESVAKEKTVLLDLLHSLFDCIARGLPEEQIYQRVVSGCRLATHGLSACFFKYKEDTQELIATTREGLFPLLKTYLSPTLSKAEMLSVVKQGERFFVGESYVGKCAQDLRPRILEADELEVMVANPKLKMHVKQLFLCPILFQKELLGVIAIVNCIQPGGFSEESCNLLKSVCEQAGIVLHNARQLQLLFEQSKIELDLTLANQIQSQFLIDPKSIHIPGIDLCITAINGLVTDFYNARYLFWAPVQIEQFEYIFPDFFADPRHFRIFPPFLAQPLCSFAIVPPGSISVIPLQLSPNRAYRSPKLLRNIQYRQFRK